MDSACLATWAVFGPEWTLFHEPMHFIHRYLLDMCHSVYVTDGESGVHEVRLLFLKDVQLD